MLSSIKHAVSGGLFRMGYQIHRVPQSGPSVYTTVTRTSGRSLWPSELKGSETKWESIR